MADIPEPKPATAPDDSPKTQRRPGKRRPVAPETETKTEKQSTKAPTRRDVINGAIGIISFHSGTGICKAGDVLYRLVQLLQHTGYYSDPQDDNHEYAMCNEEALAPLLQWLDTEAPEDFVLERRAGRIGPDPNIIGLRDAMMAGIVEIAQVGAGEIVMRPIPMDGSRETVLDLSGMAPPNPDR